MSFTAAVESVLTNYANFQGRAMRSEYWYWMLFYILLTIVIDFIEYLVRHVLLLQGLTVVIAFLLYLFLLIPSLAVAVRRLHDLDKSGWWLLIALVPLVGSIILLVWYCTPGTRGANRFGGSNFAQSGPMPMPVGYN